MISYWGDSPRFLVHGRGDLVAILVEQKPGAIALRLMEWDGSINVDAIIRGYQCGWFHPRLSMWMVESAAIHSLTVVVPLLSWFRIRATAEFNWTPPPLALIHGVVTSCLFEAGSFRPGTRSIS